MRHIYTMSWWMVSTCWQVVLMYVYTNNIHIGITLLITVISNIDDDGDSLSLYYLTNENHYHHAWWWEVFASPRQTKEGGYVCVCRRVITSLSHPFAISHLSRESIWIHAASIYGARYITGIIAMLVVTIVESVATVGFSIILLVNSYYI